MTLLGLVAALALAVAPDPVVTQEVVGTMGNIFQLEGSFDVAAPVEVAWLVLTNYAGHPRFVSELKSSVITEHRPNVTMVAQEATGRVAMFSSTVALLLRMTETPHTEITFTDTLGKDFDLFEGKWTVSSDGTGLHVGYLLRCRSRSRAPAFIIGPVMEDSTRRLMVAMRGEIEKRALAEVRVAAGARRLLYRAP